MDTATAKLSPRSGWTLPPWGQSCRLEVITSSPGITPECWGRNATVYPPFRWLIIVCYEDASRVASTILPYRCRKLFFPRMWPIMLKGSVLCVKLKEKKETEVSYKSLYNIAGITKKQNRASDRNAHPRVRYAHLSTQKQNEKQQNIPNHNTRRGQSPKNNHHKYRHHRHWRSGWLHHT